MAFLLPPPLPSFPRPSFFLLLIVAHHRLSVPSRTPDWIEKRWRRSSTGRRVLFECPKQNTILHRVAMKPCAIWAVPWAAVVPDLLHGHDGAMGGRGSSREADGHHLNAVCCAPVTPLARSPGRNGCKFPNAWHWPKNARRLPEDRLRLLSRRMMAAAALAPQSSPSLSSTRRWSSPGSMTVGSPNSLLEIIAAANPSCRASICLNISPMTLPSTCSTKSYLA